MYSRTNTFVSVLLLIIYGTLTFVSVPYHFHDDTLFATGSGLHTFAQHDDAHHCHHHSIEVHDDCIICSAASQSMAAAAGTVIPITPPTAGVCTLAIFSAVTSDAHSSHSLRGPPVVLG
ncbi:MAG: hypothetical protein WCW40_09005 [Bacteroidota bacterium]